MKAENPTREFYLKTTVQKTQLKLNECWKPIPWILLKDNFTENSTLPIPYCQLGLLLTSIILENSNFSYMAKFDA